MKPIKCLLLILIVLSFQACPEKYNPEPDMQLFIKNRSSEDIYFYANTEETVKFPKDIFGGKGYLEKIDINKEYTINFWESLFQNRKMNILIFKSSTMSKYSWSEIQSKNIIDKQYILTLEELKRMNYEIVYDGK